MQRTRSPRRFGTPLAAVAVVLLIVASASLGIQTLRTNITAARTISQDNILWSATQMEVELLRFQRALAVYALELTPGALDDLQQRFDILWSRVNLMAGERVGSLMRQYDEGFGTIEILRDDLEAIDQVIQNLQPGDAAEVPAMLAQFERHQQDMRLYTLRVVRGDTATAVGVRQTIRATTQRAVLLALIGCLLGTIALVLLAFGRGGRSKPVAA